MLSRAKTIDVGLVRTALLLKCSLENLRVAWLPQRNQKAVLWQAEPRDAAVNFGPTCRILQRHRAVSLPRHDFLVYIIAATVQMLKLHTVRWFSRP